MKLSRHTFLPRFRALVALAAALALSGSLVSTAHAQISAKAVRTKIAGIDVIAYPTGVRNVVTIQGSIPAGDRFAGENTAVPTLTGMLLDKGTTKNDRFAIAAQLERVGATIDFSVGSHMLNISAKCLKKDMPLVIGLIAEQLRTPALDPEQLEKEKKQFAGRLQRQLEDTNLRAADAFTRAAFPPGHPNRNPDPEELLKDINATKHEDIVAFHKKHYGPASFTLVATGDIDIPALQQEIGKVFAGWTGGVSIPRVQKSTGTDSAKELDVFMPGKTSVSVVMGAPSGLKYSDPDYQAVRIATAILGSGFTGRLMSNVRDKEGLTYGIGSGLASDTFTDGEWRMTATFAPALLDKGIASAKNQLTMWYEKGVTADEVARRKTNLIGTFEVGLATSDGVASNILTTVHRGFDLGWLDRYASMINGITTEQINSAIKKHLRPQDFYLVKAGTMVGAEAKK